MVPAFILQNATEGRDRALAVLRYARALGSQLRPCLVRAWSELIDGAAAAPSCLCIVDPFFLLTGGADLAHLQRLSSLPTEPDLILYFDGEGRPDPSQMALPAVRYGAIVQRHVDDGPEEFLRALVVASGHRWKEDLFLQLTDRVEDPILSRFLEVSVELLRRHGRPTLDRIELEEGISRRRIGERCQQLGLQSPKAIIDLLVAAEVWAAHVRGPYSRRALTEVLGYSRAAALERPIRRTTGGGLSSFEHAESGSWAEVQAWVRALGRGERFTA